MIGEGGTMETQATKYVGIGLVVLVLLIGYGMLNAPEQTRPLSYEKGIYGGKADQKLDQETLEALRQRALRAGEAGL